MTREAYDLLAELSGEMGIPLKRLASEIILEAAKHMELNKEVEE